MARFHPRSKSKPGPCVQVAWIRCEGPRAIIEPLPVAALGPLVLDLGALTEKLRYIIRRALPDPFQQLSRLRSEYWSFEPVAPQEGGGRRGKAGGPADETLEGARGADPEAT